MGLAVHARLLSYQVTCFTQAMTQAVRFGCAFEDTASVPDEPRSKTTLWLRTTYGLLPAFLSESANVDDPVAHREEDSLEPGAHVELSEDVHHVRAFGLDGDVQLLRYLLAVEALRERLEHLPLAGRERLDGLPSVLSRKVWIIR